MSAASTLSMLATASPSAVVVPRGAGGGRGAGLVDRRAGKRPEAGIRRSVAELGMRLVGAGEGREQEMGGPSSKEEREERGLGRRAPAEHEPWPAAAALLTGERERCGKKGEERMTGGGHMSASPHWRHISKTGPL